MEEIKSKKTDKLFEFLLVVLTIGAVAVSGYFYKFEISIIIRNLIVTGSLSIAFVFATECDRSAGNFLFGNEKSYWKFFVIYIICLLASCFLKFIPSGGWPFLCIFVSLFLFSDILISITGGILLLVIAMLISQSTDIGLFLEYAVPGILAVSLFSSVDRELKVYKPLVLSVVFQFLFLCLQEVLMSDKVFSMSLFLIPTVNTIIVSVVLLFVIRMFCYSYVYSQNSIYMDIVDPEYKLLTKLKEASKEDYDHSIYMALLCTKLAEKIHADTYLCKAMAYYHKAGAVRGTDTWEDIEEILSDNDIPQNVIVALKEYIDPSTPIRLKETVILLFADAVISSIRYLYVKDSNASIDIEKLIKVVIQKKIDSGVLSNSSISFREINTIKHALIEDKSFYDFLR